MSVTAKMRVAVFHEFEGLEILSRYCDVDVPTQSCIGEIDNETSRNTMRKNIKILYTKATEKEAYLLKERLEADGIARFITDQLYVKEKIVVDGVKQTRIIPLPKDRIVMELL